MERDILPPEYLAFGDLYQVAIEEPLKAGFNRLIAVSGFASGAFVQHLLEEHGGLRIELIIGMARAAGIPATDHEIYKTLAANKPNRLICRYYVGEEPVHAKLYAWNTEEMAGIGLVGSPNLSWYGFGGYREAIVRADAAQVLETYHELTDESVIVSAPDVPQRVPLIDPSRGRAPSLRAAHGGSTGADAEAEDVALSLLTVAGPIHTRAGLNWGQREGRDPNQAYIPVPARIHAEHPDFFPPSGHRFAIQTDDGHVFVAVIAQQNRKAIETPEDNSLLGRYFRNRIGVHSGEFVKVEDLERYGRTDVGITKIDDDLYLMDFSPQ